MNLKQVENLFIEKLLEKYQLTQRDLRRAFNKFDHDGNGFLSVGELAAAIRLYVNGVDPNLVSELVKNYDVDQDGVVSIDEFSQFLLSRESADPSKWLSVDHLTSTNGQVPIQRPKKIESTSTKDLTENKISYQAKLYLQNVKSFLIKQVLSMRESGTIPSADRLSHKTSGLIEQQSKALISVLCKPFCNNVDGCLLLPLSGFKR